MSQQDCIFCSICSGSIPAKVIAQNDDVFVIKDISPKAPVHYLIIPKKHIKDISSCSEEDQSILSSCLLMAKQLSVALPEPQAFKLYVNNGYAAGQRVFHLHFHFLAGKVFSE